MIKVGIIGGDSIEAGELLRILIFHPEVEIVFVHSTRYSGQGLYRQHSGLLGETDLAFTHHLPLEEIDVLFCCPAEESTANFLANHQVGSQLKIIDFGTEFRLPANGNEYVYALPELNRRATCAATYVANPGAIVTGASLALLPLAKHGLLDQNLHFHVQKGNIPLQSWQETDAQLTDELLYCIHRLQGTYDHTITWANHTDNAQERAVICTVQLHTNIGLEHLFEIFHDYYAEDSFTHISLYDCGIKEVLNTNKCIVYLSKEEDLLTVTTYTDALLKGSSGQAIHNMNLLFNLEETVGLQLKASVY